MDEQRMRGVDGYEFFHGSNERGVVELFEERYEEFDHSGRLLPFELTANGSNIPDYPCSFIRRGYPQSPARCRLITSKPIRTADPNVVKFLIDITTNTGELLIALIIATKTRQDN